MYDPSAPTRAAERWDHAILAPVAELNEQLLEVLRAAALPAVTAEPLLVRALRPQWLQLTPAVQRRLAACPYLLLDAGFDDVSHWLPRPAGGVGVIGVMDVPGSPGYFMSPEGVRLVRRALLFAWHLARSHPLAARVTLGMSADCARHVAACRLHDLETLAERGPGWIRPRWERQPQVWRPLLGAAVEDNPARLRQAQLRGLQLLAAGRSVRCGGRTHARVC